MGGGLVIAEPTTILRDLARTLLAIDEVWAGGWPQSNTATTGVVLTTVGSTLNAPITRWSTQWDFYAPTQPAAAALAGDLVTQLARHTYGAVIGTTVSASVLWGGIVEDTVSLRPIIPGDPDDPDTYRHMATLDLLTVAVPNP